MSYWTGRVTPNVSGSAVSFALGGFQPTWARFKMSQKDGVTETCSHLSLGSADGTRQNYSSNFTDGTGSSCFEGNNKVVSHYERSGGAITEIFSASFVAFTATGLSLNIPNANSAYKLHIECGN